MRTNKPAVLVISSHVVRGTVGNRAAAFALEVLGFSVWCLPTVILPWHPGHGPSTRSTPSQEGFAAIADDICEAKWLPEVGAVLTGYLGAEEQVAEVAKIVRAVKAANPAAQYTLDPVMGDGDALYIGEGQAHAIREVLLPLADMVTPNCFELGWLAQDTTPVNQTEVAQLAQGLGVSKVLATSTPALMAGSIGNLLLDGKSAMVAEHRAMAGPPNGLGDLTAALITAHMLDGLSSSDALLKTTSSVFEVMMASAQSGADELVLERSVDSLLNPRTSVSTRTLAL